jgi:putative transposase
MCEELKVSRSGYNQWRDRPKSARQERREELTQEVRRVYIYGSPKVTKKLSHEGI